MSQTEVPPSANSPRSSRRPMELVGETRSPDQPKSPIEQLMEANRPGPTNPTTPPPNTPQFQQEYMTRLVWKNAVLGNLSAMAMVLAARFFVLLATVGAIFLTWVALEHPDPNKIAVLGAYLLFGVIPLVWLASRK